ncbi:MAG: beta-propeller fold lactonase family protein [Gemmatimonadota bacterium]
METEAGGAAVEAWRDGSGRGHDAAPVPFPPGMRRVAEPPDRRPRLRSGEEGIGGRAALAFDGADDLLGIADAEDLNTGGPYAQRTILVVLRTGPDVRRRQMIFETGGDLRGFNVYIDEGRLYVGAFNTWNDDRGRTTPFGPVHVSAPVRPETAYRVGFVFDQEAGRLAGYLDGRKFGEAGGVGLVFLHHEDIGIGAVLEDTYYHDGVRQGVPAADFFGGRIAELLVYNEALSGRRLAAADRYLRGRYPRSADGQGSRRGPSDAAAGGGGRLYVSSGLTDEVLRLNPADGGLVTRLSVDRTHDDVDEPHGLAVDPQGEHLYVTVAHGRPSLWKFELADDRLVGRVDLGLAGVGRVGLTPDGRRAFVPDYDRSRPGEAGRVAAVELSDLTVIGTPEVCPGPHHAAVDPTGGVVAVACSLGDEIALLDAASLADIRRFPVDANPGPPGAPKWRPLNLAWSPDGGVLYVSLHGVAAVRAFDLSGAQLGTAEVGDGPGQIAITPDGSRLVSANRRDGSVSIVRLPELEETARVALEVPHPHGVSVRGDGRVAYVACEGDISSTGYVAAVDIASASVMWRVRAGAYTLGAAWAPGG